MIHRIEVITAAGQPDALGASVRDRIRRFSDFPLENIATASVYLFDGAALGGDSLTAESLPGNGGGEGAATPEFLQKLGEELFADPVLHDCKLDGEALAEADYDWYVEVGYRRSLFEVRAGNVRFELRAPFGGMFRWR